MRVVVIGAASTADREIYENYILDNLPRLPVDELIIDISSQQTRISVKPKRAVYAKLGGCLISDPDTWNDAKRAEYNDRVAHPIE